MVVEFFFAKNLQHQKFKISSINNTPSVLQSKVMEAEEDVVSNYKVSFRLTYNSQFLTYKIIYENFEVLTFLIFQSKIITPVKKRKTRRIFT